MLSPFVMEHMNKLCWQAIGGYIVLNNYVLYHYACITSMYIIQCSITSIFISGIAQKPSTQLVKAKHRMPGIQFGQIYIYPSQRWCRRKRSYISLAEQVKNNLLASYMKIDVTLNGI